MSQPAWLHNKFLSEHLQYVTHTESPIIMHVWSALTACSAALGRHAWLEQSTGKMYPNMYALLVGPPGVRKNSAINYAVNILRDCTDVKFAPDDTGGQRQGLIVAMQHSELDQLQEKGLDIDLTDVGGMVDGSTVGDIGNITLNISKQNYDKHALFICATEFGSFLGQGSLEMTRFLIKMWDAEDYRYKLRKTTNTIKNPLLNLIGGTTSADLSTLLPSEAIGQGFMSRVLLVFAAKKAKRLPPSKSFVLKEHRDFLADVYKYLFFDHIGAMTKSDTCIALCDKIYMEDIRIPDARFIHYSERRHNHLEKVAMILAATRESFVIEEEDLFIANEILKATEKSMPDALGEYGLSPLAVARQKMLEFIQHAKGPVTDTILWAMLRKDMRMLDFKNSLAELVNAGKISQVKIRLAKDEPKVTGFVYNEDMGELLDSLTEEN